MIKTRGNRIGGNARSLHVAHLAVGRTAPVPPRRRVVAEAVVRIRGRAPPLALAENEGSATREYTPRSASSTEFVGGLLGGRILRLTGGHGPLRQVGGVFLQLLELFGCVDTELHIGRRGAVFGGGMRARGEKEQSEREGNEGLHCAG